MKKLTAIILLVVSAIGMSNNVSAQFRYAGVAGATISSIDLKQDLVSVDYAVGYTAGVQGELMFPGIGFGIDLGLLYNQLGANVNLGEKKVWSSLGYGKERIYLHYIQLPLHMRFKWTRMNGLEDFFAPFVYGGPDFTILAAHGNCDAFEYAGGELGLTAGLGFEILKKWQVSASYTWGMTYSVKTKLLEDLSARNKHWSVKVAYYF